MDPNTQPPPAPEAVPAPAEDPDADANALESTDSAPASTLAPAAAPPLHKGGGIKNTLRRFNLYLLLFIFILVIAGGVVVVAYFQSKQAATKVDITSQKLDAKALTQLASSDATVGDPKQVLSVQSNAVFAGKVLIRDTLEVAGGIHVGGSVSLTGLTVSGKSSFDEIQVNKNLTVGGDTALQGGLSVQKGIQVNGGGTFIGPLSAPQVTTSILQLNGDLTLTHHIIAGGPSPSRANGPGLGSGGTASVNGSDTSGTITINTGSGAPAGCFTTISFAQKYNSVPHVVVTPIGSDAGGLDYYVTRTANNFSLCDATAPPAGVSFAFDYFVVN